MHPLHVIHRIWFALELQVTTSARILESRMVSFHMQFQIMFSLTRVLAIRTIVSYSVVDRLKMDIEVVFVAGFKWAKVTRKLHSFMLYFYMPF